MLNHKDIEKRPIKELVSGNYVFAAVLHYFGISFFQYEQSSLQDVCEKHRIKPKQLIHELESWAIRKEPSQEELFLRPIEVLVAYLKKKHYYFLRQELPFLSNMIAGIQVPEKEYSSILADLRILFPLFVDDFIHHIHEEESRVFNRIELLHNIEEGEFILKDSVKILEQSPIASLADAHEVHDDEMEGIRKLTNNYFLPENAPVSMKVLYNELQVFEKELIIHAQIEDGLLFPKAIELEKDVLRNVRKKISEN
ncbi:hemerythrin domain-containing protein [Mongoliibacter ruber]|uniref:Regulator of cell morphogenesis and NO signaling n=1 Tax=Mongoliibacter ruber TaxID=1750599 RepID=A0A2T0WLD9_9BACT|nr:hemerythrin domain-containing protein [Mongoliibacter ruber]PRY87507.1 regulator of cell morphogenesis and NO signaling [Mongoliibacter ruber]